MALRTPFQILEFLRPNSGLHRLHFPFHIKSTLGSLALSAQRQFLIKSSYKNKGLLMKEYFIACAVLTILTASFPLAASAKENSPQASKIQALDDTSFEKIIELSRPNEMQALLSSLMGEWNYTVTIWTEPNAKPLESTGTSVNQMILEGRFVSMKSSLILNVGGHYLPYEANGLMGYDNVKKVFTSVWVDNLNPGMMVGNGIFDKKSNVIKESGNFTSSIKNAIQSYRSELQFTDAESYKRIIFATDKSGKEYKIMEFVYSKKK